MVCIAACVSGEEHSKKCYEDISITFAKVG